MIGNDKETYLVLTDYTAEEGNPFRYTITTRTKP